MNAPARIRNWAEFQHYKHRSPPWIKLHRKLLDDKGFLRLPAPAGRLLMLLWLLASEAKELDGTVDIDADELEFRLRLPRKEIVDGLTPLLQQGWLEPLGGDLLSGLASTALAAGRHSADTETETEQRQKGLRLVRSAHRFEDFWKLYPAKVAKVKAVAVWKRKGLDAHADAIVADVTRRLQPATRDKRWAEGYIPHPTTYLNGERWNDEPGTVVVEPRTNGGSPKVEDTPAQRFLGLKSFLTQQVELKLVTKEEARQQCVDFKAKYGLP